MRDRDSEGDGRVSMTIELLSPEDWKLIRQARLAALQDAPESFLPAHPPESGWVEEDWRRSCKSGQWAVARHNASTVGLARLTDDEVGPHLESVWTHPDHRRQGIATALIGHLLADAERARSDVLVWIIRPNPVALRLYTSLGFEPTKEHQPIEGTDRVEERLRLRGDRHRRER